MFRTKLAAALAAVCVLVLPAASARAEGRLKVVATTSTFADLVRQVGGDRVDSQYVASPKFNVHFYPPKPSDVRKVARADLYVCSGIDLEPWSDPLLEAAGKPELFRGGSRYVDLSAGVELADAPAHLSRAEGDLHVFGNPHFSLGPQFAARMGGTIAEKLKEADPVHAAEYDANLAKFRSDLERKTAEWKTTCAHCAGKEMVSYHDDIKYLADFLGMKVERFVEAKPGIAPTPRHLEEIERAMKERVVKVIAMTSYYPRGVAEAVAGRTGARIAVIAQNSGEIEATNGFFELFDHNVGAIAEALR